MSFFEERFPECVKFGVTGGPRFSTSRVDAQNGFSSKQRNWQYPLQEWQAADGIKKEADFEKVRAFFYNVYGAFDGFRFKDWSDFRAKEGTGAILTLPGGGKQLARAYTYGARTFVRPISKPVAGTVTITGGGTLDYTTGIVTGGTPSGWVGEFDVPVEFVEDLMDVEIVNKQASNGTFFLSWASIRLREVRL